MANVNLKTDFKDGDKLFAQQLNNNFSAIVAALAAMNKIAWQDDTDESLIYFKGTTEEVAARNIIEGQLLYDLTLGVHYIDHNNTRTDVVSGSVLDVVVNSLEGEQTNKAPSVHAVKEGLNSVAYARGNYNGDLNSLKTSGYYYAGSGATNRPLGEPNGYVTVNKLDNNYVSQIYIPVEGASKERIYVRQCADGDWNSWQQIVYRITSGTSTPSGGYDGEIYLKYVA